MLIIIVSLLFAILGLIVSLAILGLLILCFKEEYLLSDSLMSFVKKLSVVTGLACGIFTYLMLYNKNLEDKRKIEIYKEILTPKEVEIIEKICNSNINCWNKERALMLGVEVKERIMHHGRTSVVKTDFIKDGVVIYAE